MRVVLRRSVFFAITAVAAGFPSSVRADEVPACGDAFDQAQSRRDEGKLIEARRLLRICSRPTCSATQQALCAEMLTDVEARVPSVVPVAKDASGADLIEVRVLIDGVEVASSINGRAVDVDPGLHTFVFVRPDGTKAETRALAVERGKGEVVAGTFGGPASLAPPSPGSSPPPPSLSPSPPGAPTPAPAPSDAPPARTAFQASLRTGVQFPFGAVGGGSTNGIGNYFSWQVPFVFDAGWKLNPNVFLGAYLGFAFGGSSGATAQTCLSANASCNAGALRGGAEVMYSFQPAATTNPWIGYGVGYESTYINVSSKSAAGGSSKVTASGWEFGHFMAGLDFRVSSVLGVGPLVDLAVGQYSTLSTSTNGTGSSSSIPQTALHEWLLLGGRVVLFP